MISLLIEGLESAFFPCTLVLLIPGMASAVGGRFYSSLAIGAFILAAVITAWFRFSGRATSWPDPLIAVALLLVGLVFLRPIARRLDLIATFGGLFVGSAAGALWVPCTGDSFGALLGDLPTTGFLGAVQLTAYMLGLLAPLVAFGALFYLIPDNWQEGMERTLASVGGGFLIVVAFLVVTGIHDDIIGQLFTWSDTYASRHPSVRLGRLVIDGVGDGLSERFQGGR